MEPPLTVCPSFVDDTSASNFSAVLTNAAEARACNPRLFHDRDLGKALINAVGRIRSLKTVKSKTFAAHMPSGHLKPSSPHVCISAGVLRLFQCFRQLGLLPDAGKLYQHRKVHPSYHFDGCRFP